MDFGMEWIYFGMEWIYFGMELYVYQELFAGISIICLISAGKHRLGHTLELPGNLKCHL